MSELESQRNAAWRALAFIRDHPGVEPPRWVRDQMDTASARMPALNGMLPERPWAVPNREKAPIVVMLRAHGLTYNAIQDATGYSKNTIHRAIRDAGLVKRGRNGR